MAIAMASSHGLVITLDDMLTQHVIHIIRLGTGMHTTHTKNFRVVATNF